MGTSCCTPRRTRVSTALLRVVPGCRAAVKEEMSRTTALLASASVDASAAYALALRLASAGKSAEAAEAIRREVRQDAQDTLRRRASRKGRADLLAILAEPEAEGGA